MMHSFTKHHKLSVMSFDFTYSVTADTLAKVGLTVQSATDNERERRGLNTTVCTFAKCSKMTSAKRPNQPSRATE